MNYPKKLTQRNILSRKVSIGQIIKKTVFVIVSLCVGLMVVEIGLRLISPRYYPIITAAYEYDAEKAFQLRPSTHAFKTTDHQQEIIANSLGTANFQSNFDEYENLLFAVGDSYTQGTGVPSDMSYPVQLDLLLNNDARGFYKKEFGVVNLGVAGYGGEQSLLNLERYAGRLKAPRIILYLGCDNDYEDDLVFKSGYTHKIVIAGSPEWGYFTNPLRFLLEKTQIGLLTRVAYRQQTRDRMVSQARRNFSEKTSTAELEKSVYERLKAYAEKHNSLLIISWSDSGESYNWLRSWSAQNNVIFADWSPKAESIQQAMPQLSQNNMHSGGHHRGWVNQIIAQEFARHIRLQIKSEHLEKPLTVSP